MGKATSGSAPRVGYCSRCVTPTSHPRVLFDESGLCSACQAHDKREDVDWAARSERFAEVVEFARSNSKGYDCLIPVSGGKDSFWQAVTCLEYGLNPLCVTWKDPARLEIGRTNLQALIDLGVDHMDIQVNPKVEKVFLYKSLVQYGVPGIPKHMALYNIPLNMAVRFDVPLIVWGENAAIEYGDIEDEHSGFQVDYDWLITHGVTQGTTAEDWISEDLSRKALTPYFAPSRDMLENHPVRAVYLGYYFPWDPLKSYELAAKRGFEAPDVGPGYYNFDDVDSGFISIHHYIKWFKFGYTRLFDNLSYEIRHGRVSRADAIDIIANRGPETPRKDIEAFCKYLDISVAHFTEIVEGFRNRDIWVERNGHFEIDGYLVENWDGWD